MNGVSLHEGVKTTFNCFPLAGGFCAFFDQSPEEPAPYLKEVQAQ